jgi:hypothetical protein
MSGVAQTDVAAADAVGKAVSLDDTAASTVKLAGDGDTIFGRVFQAENRDVLDVVTAAIQRRFKEKLPATAGHGITVGDSVVGAGAGLVKVALAPNNTIVVEVGTDFVVVEQL